MLLASNHVSREDAGRTLILLVAPQKTILMMLAFQLVGVSIAAPSSAQSFVTFGDRSSWVAATTGYGTLQTHGAEELLADAPGYALIPFYSPRPGFVVGRGESPVMFANNQPDDPLYDWGTGTVLVVQPYSGSPRSQFDIALPTGTRAFGFSFGGFHWTGSGWAKGMNGVLDVSTADGVKHSYLLAALGTSSEFSFAGMLSDFDIERVVLTYRDMTYRNCPGCSLSPAEQYGIADDFALRSEVVPEPTSLVLLATGLGIAGLALGRRKHFLNSATLA